MAGKPEDISQKAWDAAEACFPGNSWNQLTVERVARAIMAAAAAEREACAVAAQQHADTWIAGEAATTTGRMFQSACRSVAKTIRKRGEA